MSTFSQNVCPPFHHKIHPLLSVGQMSGVADYTPARAPFSSPCPRAVSRSCSRSRITPSPTLSSPWCLHKLCISGYLAADAIDAADPQLALQSFQTHFSRLRSTSAQTTCVLVREGLSAHSRAWARRCGVPFPRAVVEHGDCSAAAGGGDARGVVRTGEVRDPEWAT
jgi:hypothetical protein